MRRFAAPIAIVGAILVVVGALAALLATGDTWLPAVNAGVGALLVVGAAALQPALFRQYGRWLNAAWGGIMVLAILVMVNFLADRYPKRVDVTEGQLHSLAPLTIETLQGLPTDVEAVAFMEGGQDPELRVLLEQYETHGAGRFSFEFVDPDRDPERTRDFGVRVYNTLVLATEDGARQTLTELTEKEVTNALLKVVRDRRETVCFTVGHGERGLSDHEQDLGALKARLQEVDYALQDSVFLARSGRVPEDCSVVVVAGPRTPFLRTEVEALRTYLHEGGAALILVDPLTETGLRELVGEWGIELGDDFVIDTSGLGSLFGLDFTIPTVARYDAEHPIVRQHRGGVMTSFELARSVRLDSAAVSTMEAEAALLAQTSEASWGETDLDVLRGGDGAEERTVSLDDTDSPGPLGLAAAVRDSVGGGARLVVFGDSDFATNRYFDLQGNGDLALNAISWLAEDEALISIRPRTAGYSPIALTEGQADLVFWVTVVLFPLVIAVIGFLVVSRGGSWSVRDLAAAGVGVVLSLGVLALLNFVGDRYHWRFDVTEDQLYTLAPETRDVLDRAAEEGRLIQVKTFMGSMEGMRFQDLMREVDYAARDFDFETVDPQKEALQVRQYGIRERGTSIVEVTGDGHVQVERFTDMTEAGLANAIRRALDADERTIAFAGGHGEGRLSDVDGEGYSILGGRLAEMNLQVREGVELSAAGLADVQVLALLGPQASLAPAEVAAVRGFLAGGGDLLLLLDPGVDSGLEPLLRDDYQVDVGDDFAVDLSGLGQLLGTDVSVPVVLRYGEHPITQRLARGTMSFFPVARSVSAVNRFGDVTELLFTDRNAWGESDLGILSGASGDGTVDYDPETDRQGPLSLGVAVAADADSASGQDKTRIVVIGDADFARNQYVGEQANGELLAAAVRWLTEGDEVLTIPERTPRFNPINLAGTAGGTILWLSVFVLPFGVALSGFVIMLRRGYESYAGGFLSWLVYSFAAIAVYYLILAVLGVGEGSWARGQGFLALALVTCGVAWGLLRRMPAVWPVAVAAAVANTGLGFLAIPEPTLQLVFAGLNIANGCILVWIRRDFQPGAPAEASA